MGDEMKTENVAIKYMDERYLGRSAPGKLYKFWENKEGQFLRFKILSEIGNLNGRSVLDVGCGLGEFYYFCKKEGVNITEYTGIDIHPKIVKQANNNFHKLNIICMDIMENSFKTDSFDYVVASGLSNFKCNNWNKRIQFIINECHRISRLGVAMNFLRFRKENRTPMSHYVKYRHILKIVEQHTNRFVLRADYKKNDFTIYIHKKLLVTK